MNRNGWKGPNALWQLGQYYTPFLEGFSLGTCRVLEYVWAQRVHWYLINAFLRVQLCVRPNIGTNTTLPTHFLTNSKEISAVLKEEAANIIVLDLFDKRIL